MKFIIKGGWMIRTIIAISEMVFGGLLFALSIFKIIQAQFFGKESAPGKWALFFLAIAGIFISAEGWLKIIAHNQAADMARAIYFTTFGIFLIAFALSLPTGERKQYLLLLTCGIGLTIIGLLVLTIGIADVLGYQTP